MLSINVNKKIWVFYLLALLMTVNTACAMDAYYVAQRGKSHTFELPEEDSKCWKYEPN